MPRFVVLITRDVTESTTVTVEANGVGAAEAAAVDRFHTSEDAVWTVDDGSWNLGDAYITAVNVVEE